MRDTALDAARVVALLCVVTLHILLVTLWTDPATGALTQVMAPTSASWYPVASWALQVMPIFVVVGGCASAISWTRARERGVRGPEWVRTRLLGLALPGALLWSALAAGSVLARAAGAPQDWTRMGLQGLGMHLWFLGAYAVCLMLVPWLHSLHERRPWAVLGALAAAVVAVEALRLAMGDPWWGMLGYACVWPLIQQIGFLRHDGAFARAPRWALVLIASAAVVLLIIASGLPWWPRDGLAALNPPTAGLVLLGAAQACVLELLSGPLERVMARRPAQLVAWAVGARAITLYLWHLPVIVAVMAVWWLLGGPSPEPGSAAWWLWRIPLLVLCWALVLLVVHPLGAAQARLAGALGVDRPARAGVGRWAQVLVPAVLIIAPALLEVRFLLFPALVLTGTGAMLLAAALLLPRSSRVSGAEPCSSAGAPN